MTKKTLTEAKALAHGVEQARTNLETFLAPFLKRYIEFILEVNPTYYTQKDTAADTFTEVENEHFNFEGETYYEYGDYETPQISLPFAFVADPEKYMAEKRAQKAAQEAKHAAANEKRAKDKIELLRKQLAQAESALTAANAQGDSIKATANRNLLDKAGL